MSMGMPQPPVPGGDGVGGGSAGPVGVVNGKIAAAIGEVLGPVFKLVVLVPAHATGHGQNIGKQVEIDGAKYSCLPIAALHVLTEPRIRVGAKSRRAGIRSGQGPDGRKAAHTAVPAQCPDWSGYIEAGSGSCNSCCRRRRTSPSRHQRVRAIARLHWYSGGFRGSGADRRSCRSSWPLG